MASTLPERARARRGEHTSARLRAALALAQPLRPRPEGCNVVVKSVQACLAMEWIARRFDPTVIAVERNPLNILASWDELRHGVDPFEYAALREVASRRWGIALPEVDAPQVARQAAFLGVLRGSLAEAATRAGSWIRVCHEELLDAPAERLADLCSRAGLTFSDESAAYVRDSNRRGEGYSTKRVAKDLPRKWRQLTDDQISIALDTLRRFPPHLGLEEAAEKGTQ